MSTIAQSRALARAQAKPRKNAGRTSPAASNDATPERLQRAREGGVTFMKEKVQTDSGMDTGTKRRRFEHPIDTAGRLNWITAEMHAAGCRIRYLMDGARSAPRITSGYLAAVDGSTTGMHASDRREYCQKAYSKACDAIRDRERRQFISWLEECEVMEMSVSVLGAWFTPRQHAQAVAEAGILVLRSVTTDLAEHFGYMKKQFDTIAK